MVKLCYLIIGAIKIFNIGLVECDCTLKINRDFGTPYPLMFKNNTLMLPDTGGHFQIKAGSHIRVICTGPKGALVYGRLKSHFATAKLECMPDKKFQTQEWEGPFKEFRCNFHPMYTAEDTHASCYGSSRIIRVGFKAFDQFFLLYEACFDASQLATHYVKHQLIPATMNKQGGNKPPYIQGRLFPDLAMNDLYNKESQVGLMKSRFGKTVANKYKAERQHLSRCLLAPRGDFSMYNHQRATFHYINVAPQWSSLNHGNWNALENALRLRINALGKPATIYTGVHGDLTFLDQYQYHKHFYMFKDKDYNNFIPVPLYFYKLVYDEEKKHAAAFIIINKPHYNSSEDGNLVFCTSICKEFDWLKWSRSDISFCCTYEEFIKKVKRFPILDVKGVFK